MPKNQFNNFSLELARLEKTNFLHTIKEDKNRVYVFLITLKNNFSNLEPVLHKYNFEIYKYNYYIDGTPKQILNTISKEIDSINIRRDEIEQELSRLHEENKYIYPLYDYLNSKLEKEDVIKYFKKSDKTVAIRGWIQNKDIPKLENYLKKYFTAYEIHFLNQK